MTTFAEELEAELRAFYRKVFEHSYVLGQEFPDESDPAKVFDPCNAEDLENTKQSIIKLHKSRMEES